MTLFATPISTVRYARAPSSALCALLSPGGLLFPLLERRVVNGLALDVHLREDDHVHVYCGLTRLLDAWAVPGGARLDAARSYTQQPCAAALFRMWRTGESGFDEALDLYFAGVRVEARWTGKEGAVQAAWARVVAPWVPFDREAVLGYEGAAAQTVARTIPAVRAAYAEVEPLRRAEGWAALGEPGGEADQLAVDPEGRLVLLELKDAGSSSGSVYYAPLQLLQYVHEWAGALDVVRRQLHALRDARIALGLSPASLPAPSAGLRPVVAFGEDLRSAEVARRFERVRSVVNRHLPAGVPPVEVWELRSSLPVRLR